ncbi:MAG: patatin, partial [Phycisphaerae bacterium]|nr:patatin [Phycisphaerae bacterium]
VRASISIPSLVTPIQNDGMMLIDGGVLNPIPVAPTISDHSDLTIAVNLYADLLKSDIHLPDNVIENQSVIRGVVLKTQKSIVKEENVPLPILNVLEKTLDSIQRTLISYHLGGYPPDILINIPMDICGTFDFHKANQTIEAGKIAARNTFSILKI